MLIDWEKELLTASNEILLALVDAEEMAEGRNNAEANKLISDARKAYETISDGKGVHNYMLATDIAAAAKKKLEKAKGLLK